MWALITGYLKQLAKKFSLYHFRNMDEWGFKLDKYELLHKQNKSGGTVGLYVDKNLNYNVVESMAADITY